MEANRIKSMDTLRAIAILLVMLAHTILGFGAPKDIAPFQLGGIGVDLFFVLSGWLLGNVLFKDMLRGKIDPKRFWIRRWMRTLPAYYAVLIFTILQQILTKENPVLGLDYFVFIQNYNPPMQIFSVSWSLAVEEQFYLFIPLFLLVMSSFSRHSRLLALLTLLTIPSVFRVLGLFENLEQTHVRLDGCIMGVLLACIRNEHKELWTTLEKNAGILFTFSLIAFSLYFLQRWIQAIPLNDPSILERAIMFGCWIVYANSSSSRLTNFYFPGAYHIATRSYAMYLLHPDAIAIINRFLSIDNYFAYFALVMVITLAASEILYRFIEQPIMNMRQNYSFSR